MNGAQSLISRDTVLMSNKPTHIDTFNLHVPYDQAWCLAQDELCDRNGWKLGNHSAECQSFNLRGKCTVSIMRGKVDLNEQFVPGTDDTDTYVEIRKLKR